MWVCSVSVLCGCILQVVWLLSLIQLIYELNVVRLTSEPLLVDRGTCVRDCGADKTPVNRICEPCDGPCPKGIVLSLSQCNIRKTISQRAHDVQYTANGGFRGFRQTSLRPDCVWWLKMLELHGCIREGGNGKERGNGWRERNGSGGKGVREGGK